MRQIPFIRAYRKIMYTMYRLLNFGMHQLTRYFEGHPQVKKIKQVQHIARLDV